VSTRGNARRFTIFLVVGALCASATGLLAGSGHGAASAASSRSVIFHGYAYGTSASGAGLAHSGPTAVTGLDCLARVGDHHGSTIAGVDRPGVMSTGAIATAVSAAQSPTGAYLANATSQESSVTLLGGMLNAESVSASSVTSLAEAGISTTGAVDLAGATLLGQPLPDSPARNTKVAVPGVGTLVLNEEQRSTDSQGTTTLVVSALDLHVSQQNTLGLPVGSQLIVGHTRSGITDLGTRARVDGHGFGTSLTSGSTVVSGRTAFQPLACLGTDGTVQQRSLAAVAIPGVVSTGLVTSSVEAVVIPGASTVTTGDVVDGVRVLPDGLTQLLTASAVTAQAHISSVDGVRSSSDSGSGFSGLQVAGFPAVGDDVAPNTALTIPGVGTLYLHRVIQAPHWIEVRMIELVVTGSAPGLASGSDLIISDAKASVP
jgi:hypothetical protein